MGMERVFKLPPTTQEAVLQELRRAIIDGEMKPGERVHQEALAQRLGVSRVPIREALRALEAEGQVVNKQNRGYYVAELTVSELEEIYLLRGLLEDEMNRRAVAHVDETIVKRLESLLAEMDDATKTRDVRRFVALNKEFHFTIFRCSRLPRFVRVIEVLWQNSEVYRSVYLNDPEVLRRVGEEHRLIVEACRRRDATALVEHSRRHRNGAVSRLASLLKD
jgi:DNA-binding GntR family transcriptional regulator